MLNSEGKLRIRAYTASGALPVENALVKIKGAEEDIVLNFNLYTEDSTHYHATYTGPAIYR